MTGWIERLVLTWLHAVAPRGWSDTVIGDLHEDIDERRGFARVRAIVAAAGIATRFTLEAFHARSRAPRRGRRNMDILTDLRQAARSLARTPAFTLVAIVTLALAIGANTAIYSALSSLVLNPLPFKDGDRFVYLWQVNPEASGLSLSPRKEAADLWRGATHIFEAIEQYDSRPMTLVGSGEPAEVDVTFLRPSTLELFGIQPVVGRRLAERDTEASAPPVVLISHALWQSRFGRDPGVVGRSLTLDEASYTIVGVMPARFVVPMGSDAIWAAERRGLDGDETLGRSTIAKLSPGVTREQAQAALDAMPGISDSHSKGEWKGRMMSPAEYHGKGLTTALFVLSGAVGLLLLIACVNIANLTLSRHGARRREIAVRLALGASRSRLARYLLAESAILAGAGGLAGVGVAHIGLSAMAALRPENLDALERLAIDPASLAFALAATILTGVIFGLGPAVSASGVNLNDAIKTGGRTATASGQGVRNVLTVIQVALALILLVGAGLLMRSYAKVIAVDPGYNADGVLAVDVSLPASRYPEANKESRQRFFDEALQSISALPGVTAAAVGSMPARPVIMMAELSVEGRSDVAAKPQILAGGFVTPSYFSALGIPLREGRSFQQPDTREGARVVIINETFAKEFWPGEGAVGKRVRLSRTAKDWSTIVGVAADVTFGGRTGMSAGRLQVYFPRGHNQMALGTFIIRTSGEPTEIVPAVKAKIWAIDGALPLGKVATAHELLARSVSERRFNLVLLGVFAACGLVLAVVGVYGVTALFVGQREREVGIRMALGATRPAVARMVLRQTVVLVGGAVAAGGLGAWMLSRYLESLVFATATTDALTFAAAIAAVVIASIAATLVPLRRATTVDPAIVLRAE